MFSMKSIIVSKTDYDVLFAHSQGSSTHMLYTSFLKSMAAFHRVHELKPLFQLQTVFPSGYRRHCLQLKQRLIDV